MGDHIFKLFDMFNFMILYKSLFIPPDTTNVLNETSIENQTRILANFFLF